MKSILHLYVNEPSPSDRICDFCSDPYSPLWAYPCVTYSIIPSVVPNLYATMHDEWAACPACSHLIDTAQHAALARRLHTAGHHLSTRTDRESMSVLLQAIIELHDGFRRSRLHGPPSRVK